MFRSKFFGRRLAAHCALVAVFASSVPAFAGETIYFQGTAKSRSSSAIAVSDITNTVKWGISEFSAENDYVIDGGRFCGFQAKGTFPGHSLTLGHVGGTSGALKNNAQSNGTNYFSSLILNNGEIYVKNAKKTIDAPITVNAESSAPFTISVGPSSGGALELRGSISGSGDFRIGRDETQTAEYEYSLITSDMSGFTGTMFAGIKDDTAAVSYRSLVYFRDVSIGGGLSVRKSGVIAPWGTAQFYGELSTKRLSFSADATVRFSVDATTGGTIRVTESLTLPASGTVNLNVRALPSNNFSVRRHPVIIAPANSGMSAERFALSFPSRAIAGRLEACRLEVDDTLPDCEILYLVMDKYTCLTKQDGWYSSCWEEKNSANWSGVAENTPLDPDMINISDSYQVVTPNTTISTFGGKRFVFSYTSIPVICATSTRLTVDDLVMMQGSYFYFWNLTSPHLYGNLRLTKPTNGYAVRMHQGNGYYTYIHSNISGDGPLQLYGVKGGSSISAIANFCLYGTNTAFSGKLSVTNAVNNALTNTTLLVADARSLGGPMPSFTYDGIDFCRWSRLRVTNSLAITEPTRGVFFSGGNYVQVQGAANELTLASQTTLAGTLVKEGAGTLALGGTLKFTSAQSDTPSEGTNVLQVKAGRIRPVSKGGADGLAISFAAGTGLRLAPLSEPDDDVRQYGLYDVKWATPFDLSATDGKLDVALDLPASADDIPDSFTFGVCTVASAAAGALDGNINLPTISRRMLTLTQESNGDGTVTFMARYSKRGFVVSFR